MPCSKVATTDVPARCGLVSGKPSRPRAPPSVQVGLEHPAVQLVRTGGRRPVDPPVGEAAGAAVGDGVLRGRGRPDDRVVAADRPPAQRDRATAGQAAAGSRSTAAGSRRSRSGTSSSAAPNVERKASPLTVTSFLLPSSTISSTRPYQSPLPSRCVTTTRVSVPSHGPRLLHRGAGHRRGPRVHRVAGEAVVRVGLGRQVGQAAGRGPAAAARAELGERRLAAVGQHLAGGRGDGGVAARVLAAVRRRRPGRRWCRRCRRAARGGAAAVVGGVRPSGDGLRAAAPGARHDAGISRGTTPRT